MTTLEKVDFKDLNEEFAKSKSQILGLKEDWDGEGSKGFNEEVWICAINFLKKLTQKLYENYQLIILTPKIRPIADLSIDINWKTDNMELIINFIDDMNEFPCFFGKDSDGNEIEGSMSTDKLDSVILLWLEMHQ